MLHADVYKRKKEFSCSWIVGSADQRISNVDHTKTEQHKVALTCYHIEQSWLVCL